MKFFFEKKTAQNHQELLKNSNHQDINNHQGIAKSQKNCPKIAKCYSKKNQKYCSKNHEKCT